ncbi:MAG: tetratricopeptide repeat protein [Alphaproteobacteria bacterium]|nr:tetratricopeptide repeat protein [Alphaproteobacteria bacterium]
MPKKKSRISTPKTVKQHDRLVRTGTNYCEQGNYTEALRYFTCVLDYEGYNPNVLVLMARCLFGLGMKNKAIKILEHALDQNAENPAICESLGTACLSFSLYDLAIKFFNVYCQLVPNEPAGYNNLATALREDGQLDESIQLLQDVIPIYPESAILWNSLGGGVSFRDGFPVAQPFYEEAYRLNPKVPMFSSNLCLLYANMGYYQKAFEFAWKTIELAPNAATSYRSLTETSYNIGNFKDAFTALAWHNHPSEPGSVFMPYDIEKWQGQDVKGKTILIGAEQGIGDEILFSSLYPALIQEAKHVIIGCDKRLVKIFQNSFPQATVLPYIAGQHEAGYSVRLYDGIDPQQIDYMCLYTELMRYRWHSVDDIPDMSDGLLIPPADKVSYWRQKLSELPHPLNIGFCWRSGLKQARRRMFYATLTEWLPVLKTENVNFINLQYGECGDEIQQLFEEHGVILHNFDELDLKDDFEGKSALTKNLDLSIGPITTPVVEAAASGSLCWWIEYNRKPWWSFGFEEKSPIFMRNRIIIKPPLLSWDKFMPLFAKQEFIPWVREKLKEKSGQKTS